jgi:hypothetical protein
MPFVREERHVNPAADGDRPVLRNTARPWGRPRASKVLVTCALLVIAGCTRAGMPPEGEGASTAGQENRRATHAPATLARPHAQTATALYVILNETPLPPETHYDGLPPLVDWQLEVDRAPCAGETVVLRSRLDFGLESRLATELEIRELSGELWLEFPSNVLSIVRARPGPTRVEGHGRPDTAYRAVWEDVVLTAGSVDVRELTFKAHEEHDHQRINAWFAPDPPTHETQDGRVVTAHLQSSGLYLQVGGPTQAPQAVANMWEIETEDTGSRCTPPAGTASP